MLCFESVRVLYSITDRLHCPLRPSFFSRPSSSSLSSNLHRLPSHLLTSRHLLLPQQADEVFRLGQLEYIYRWRGAENSTAYSTLKYAAWMMELRSHLKAKISGTSQKLCPSHFPPSFSRSIAPN